MHYLDIRWHYEPDRCKHISRVSGYVVRPATENAIMSLLYQWRDYFQELRNNELFAKDNLWDQIAVLAIYIPILREEIHRYARTWNGAANYGIKPNNDLLRDLQSEVSDFDVDEYLPPTTKAFCIEKLKELGYSRIKQADSQPDGSRTHRLAYLQLRRTLEDHIRLGSHPRLSQSQKPRGAWQWKNENSRTSIQKLQESQDEIEEIRIDMDGPDELAVPRDFNLNFED
ncbi:hypothetical protein Egran_01247 [Elaphomyces granulatus]|uniref:Clr5 domain-containing protein n=1 Tax=Elaphomyces granulatus TaxID=519963 RepID=A0A232M4H5_9EURO|nr:hypothetical protein Egran_01247 [Elaphomyces granulatus]